LADEIAYNAHDIDDGVRSGLITLEQLQELALFADFQREALREHPHLGAGAQSRRLLYETIRRMLSAQVYDVIDATQQNLRATAPANAEEMRALPAQFKFSADMQRRSDDLKRFLFQNLYRHPQVMQTTGQARQVVRELFDLYAQQPQEMQAGFAARATAALERTGGQRRAMLRVVADYIAGMTDRFASREHERLTGQRLLG
jgi:dGTPase